METPLYEYDQVITCPELVNVIEQLVDIYNKTSKWKVISRIETKAVINAMLELHDALHLKTELLNRKGAIQ